MSGKIIRIKKSLERDVDLFNTASEGIQGLYFSIYPLIFITDMLAPGDFNNSDNPQYELISKQVIENVRKINTYKTTPIIVTGFPGGTIITEDYLEAGATEFFNFRGSNDTFIKSLQEYLR